METKDTDKHLPVIVPVRVSESTPTSPLGSLPDFFSITGYFPHIPPQSNRHNHLQKEEPRDVSTLKYLG